MNLFFTYFGKCCQVLIAIVHKASSKSRFLVEFQLPSFLLNLYVLNLLESFEKSFFLDHNTFYIIIHKFFVKFPAN